MSLVLPEFEVDDDLYNDIFKEKEEKNMFDKIKDFCSDHGEVLMIVGGYAVGILGMIPLYKWACKATSRAITNGINNSRLVL